MAATLFKTMRLRYWVKEQDPTHVISWTDFVKFFSIATKRYPKLINTHFIPIYTKCGLCMRQFDYIVKAETSEEDAAVILSELKIDISQLGKKQIYTLLYYYKYI